MINAAKQLDSFDLNHYVLFLIRQYKSSQNQNIQVLTCKTVESNFNDTQVPLSTSEKKIFHEQDGILRQYNTRSGKRTISITMMFPQQPFDSLLNRGDQNEKSKHSEIVRDSNNHITQHEKTTEKILDCIDELEKARSDLDQMNQVALQHLSSLSLTGREF